MTTAIQRKRALRAVVASAPTPATVPDELTRRALDVYPDGPTVFGQWVERDALRDAWVAAVRWMRDRPGGPLWIMDAGSATPKWQAGGDDGSQQCADFLTK